MWTIFVLPLILLGFLLFSGMDRKQAFALAGAVLAVGVVSTVLFPRAGQAMNSAKSTAQAQDFISRYQLDLDPETLGVAALEDTHEGFHGDGESLQYFEVKGQAPDLKDWQTLPLPEEIVQRATVLSGDTERNLLTESLPLEELRGRWKLVGGADDGASSQEAWTNWSVAIYDEDKNAFYLYQFDS